MFLCVCVCVYVCVYLSLRLYVCVISNQSTSKKRHYVLEIRKYDLLLRKIHSEEFLVVGYQDFICLDP